MNKTLFFIFLLYSALLHAGNDTKRGQAGATELLINPFSRQIGMSNSYAAGVRGIESMWLNLGGLTSVRNMEFGLYTKNYLSGTGINITTAAFAKNMAKAEGDRSVLGINVMFMNLGDIQETTELAPEGTGVVVSPQFFNASVAYARKFSDAVSSGILVKFVSQQVAQANAFGACVDAGIQYKNRTEKFKAGISIKNLGPKMRFNGPGFAVESQPTSRDAFELSMEHKRELFEMPAMLILGTSYDVLSDTSAGLRDHRITAAFSFISNSYTHDHFNVGSEYAFREMFMIRLGMMYQNGLFSEDRTDVHTGLTAGFGINVLSATQSFIKKENKKDFELAFDYGYQSSNPFGGTHSFGAVLKF